MNTIPYHLNNKRGSVIVAALMILALLTILGFAATNMSNTELNISTNSLLYERAFYTAEAGLERAKESLRAPFIDQNTAKLKASMPVDEFANEFGVKIMEGDFETVAGMVITKLGKIPAKNELVDFGAFSLTVIEKDGHKITTLTARKKIQSGPQEH